MKLFNKLCWEWMEKAYDKGFMVGLKLGMQIGNIHGDSKGLIVSSRVRQEIEKILEENDR